MEADRQDYLLRHALECGPQLSRPSPFVKRGAVVAPSFSVKFLCITTRLRCLVTNLEQVDVLLPILDVHLM
ncbi:hypothetical protein HPB49_007353 [Dermacentor silvarum]|uniref:Uncharacterized protein n=1 Tax=Dermacentor silvarum TaxID=543639 RepID=A0ACB8CVS7_DERSI|nr:hypothetical protein HPB49_007353 [Dermacentor silvarum]